MAVDEPSELDADYFVHTFAVIAAAGHALIWKRDPGTALGWIAVCILFSLADP